MFITESLTTQRSQLLKAQTVVSYWNTWTSKGNTYVSNEGRGGKTIYSNWKRHQFNINKM